MLVVILPIYRNYHSHILNDLKSHLNMMMFKKITTKMRVNTMFALFVLSNNIMDQVY